MINHNECYINPAVSKKAVQKFLDAFIPETNDLLTLQIYHQNRMVVRIAAAPYSIDDKMEVYSLSKGLTSTAIGFLVDEGKLSVEDRIIDLFPDKVPEVVSENLAKMRLKHVLTMTTGHHDCTMIRVSHAEDPVQAFLSAEVQHEPGTFYCYDTGASCFLSCLVERISGMKLVDFLTPKLFLPLGIHGITWNTVRDGSNEGGCGLHLSSDDIIKIGLLYANKGVWKNKQLLSEEWIREATTPVVDITNSNDPNVRPKYAYQFWCQENGMYSATGAYGQLCVIYPKYDMVIALQSEQRSVPSQYDLVAELAEHLLDEDDTESLIIHSFPPLSSEQKTAGFENIFYKLNENPFGWTGIYFMYDNQNNAMHAVVSNGRAHQVIAAGNGYYAESTVYAPKLKPKITWLMPTFEVEACRLMCSYSAENGKLIFRVRYRNSPNRIIMVFNGNDEEISIDLVSDSLIDRNARHLSGHRCF